MTPTRKHSPARSTHGRKHDPKSNTPSYDSRRGNTTERGYGHDWRKIRDAYLLANPLCVHCKSMGIHRLANEVDHIRPKIEGGTDDAANLQSLCKSCHSRKTRRDQKRQKID